MVRTADCHRHDMELQEGQQVWLSTKYLPLKSASRKLSALWAGPYRVTGRVGAVAYRLSLPRDWGIHDVFHVSQLKAVVGTVYQEQ